MLGWGLPRLRDLPWRHTRDPWAVLVSEVMLQQTQVPRVIPKWHAFLERVPHDRSVRGGAAGRRAAAVAGARLPAPGRNLHGAAARGRARSAAFPRTLDGLLALPGVGAYTARAVLAFAFEADAAVVDTNIARVFARARGPLARRRREVQALADASLPPGDGWAWNQCLMDLGAVLCRPAPPGATSARCAPTCAWRGDRRRPGRRLGRREPRAGAASRAAIGRPEAG